MPDNTSYRLRILHLSDLHERVALPWMSPERRAKVHRGEASRYRVLGPAFFEALAQMRESSRVDLLCFTGDVADWGLPEEYAKAHRLFQTIIDALGMTRERLFVIPGNHDVQRQAASTAWEEIRRLARENSGGLSKWMAGEDPPYGASAEWRDQLQQRTSAFWQWVERDLKRDALIPNQSRHGRLGYRVTIEDIGLPFPLHVMGLDSAWLCGDDNDTGKLMLTDAQVDMLTTDTHGAPLPGFRLGLVHHPLTDLADGVRCRRLLANSVDLLLHGHQHDPIAEERVDPDRHLRVLAAGSLYEGDFEDRWINGFHCIDAHLDSTGHPMRYDVEFWGWSERGHWHRSGALYRSAQDGRLTWQVSDRERWPSEANGRPVNEGELFSRMRAIFKDDAAVKSFSARHFMGWNNSEIHGVSFVIQSLISYCERSRLLDKLEGIIQREYPINHTDSRESLYLPGNQSQAQLSITKGVLEITIHGHIDQQKPRIDEFVEDLRRALINYFGLGPIDILITEIRQGSLIIRGVFSELAMQRLEQTDVESLRKEFGITKVEVLDSIVVRLDFRGARLRNVDLSGDDLRNADFRGADLQGALLRRTNLRLADLRRANLKMASLQGADLRGANLSEAILEQADLSAANIDETILDGANLKGADLRLTNLHRASLSNAVLDQDTKMPYDELT